MADDTTTMNTQNAPQATTGTQERPRGRGRSGGKRDERGGDRPQRRREERPRSEFDQKIIDIRRVTRVVSGGRRFSFSVALVAGDRRGRVGVGIGKAGDTALAIDKATRDAKKNMRKIRTTESMSISHDVNAKYASCVVEIRPAPGRGIVAGSSVRNVLELAGIKDVTAKIFSRSKNKLNNARAAVKALENLKG